MVIGVHAGPHQHVEGLAAVGGDADPRVEAVDAVRVLRVDAEVEVVEGSVTDIVVRARLTPREAAVLRLVEGVLLGLDQRVDDVRIRRRDGQAHAAQVAFGQPVLRRQLLPAAAAVHGQVQTRARTARTEEPGPAPVVPHRH